MTDIVYVYGGKVYLNITNRCPCNCTFCIRKNRGRPRLGRNAVAPRRSHNRTGASGAAGIRFCFV